MCQIEILYQIHKYLFITNLMFEVSQIAKKNVNTIDLSPLRTLNTDCAHLYGADKGHGRDGHQPCWLLFLQIPKECSAV